MQLKMKAEKLSRGRICEHPKLSAQNHSHTPACFCRKSLQSAVQSDKAADQHTDCTHLRRIWKINRKQKQTEA